MFLRIACTSFLIFLCSLYSLRPCRGLGPDRCTLKAVAQRESWPPSSPWPSEKRPPRCRPFLERRTHSGRIGPPVSSSTRFGPAPRSTRSRTVTRAFSHRSSSRSCAPCRRCAPAYERSAPRTSHALGIPVSKNTERSITKCRNNT